MKIKVLFSTFKWQKTYKRPLVGLEEDKYSELNKINRDG